MFVIYKGTTPLVAIQIEGNEIKIGVPASMVVAGQAHAAQPVTAGPGITSAPRAWKMPEPSVN